MPALHLVASWALFLVAAHLHQVVEVLEAVRMVLREVCRDVSGSQAEGISLVWEFFPGRIQAEHQSVHFLCSKNHSFLLFQPYALLF